MVFEKRKMARTFVPKGCKYEEDTDYYTFKNVSSNTVRMLKWKRL
jgi:hypothetical protein